MSRKKRGQELSGKTVKVKTSCGTLFTTINKDEEGNIIEIMVRLGKSGQCISSLLEGIARNISVALQSGTDIEDCISTLENLACPSPFIDDGIKYTSCCDAIAKVVKKEYKGEDKKEEKKK